MLDASFSAYDPEQTFRASAATVVKATDHELDRAACVRQRAAILAGAPWWPVDPLQV